MLFFVIILYGSDVPQQSKKKKKRVTMFIPGKDFLFNVFFVVVVWIRLLCACKCPYYLKFPFVNKLIREGEVSQCVIIVRYFRLQRWTVGTGQVVSSFQKLLTFIRISIVSSSFRLLLSPWTYLKCFISAVMCWETFSLISTLLLCPDMTDAPSHVTPVRHLARNVW